MLLVAGSTHRAPVRSALALCLLLLLLQAVLAGHDAAATADDAREAAALRVCVVWRMGALRLAAVQRWLKNAVFRARTTALGGPVSQALLH